MTREASRPVIPLSKGGRHVPKGGWIVQWITMVTGALTNTANTSSLPISRVFPARNPSSGPRNGQRGSFGISFRAGVAYDWMWRMRGGCDRGFGVARATAARHCAINTMAIRSHPALR